MLLVSISGNRLLFFSFIISITKDQLIIVSTKCFNQKLIELNVRVEIFGIFSFSKFSPFNDFLNNLVT